MPEINTDGFYVAANWLKSGVDAWESDLKYLDKDKNVGSYIRAALGLGTGAALGSGWSNLGEQLGGSGIPMVVGSITSGLLGTAIGNSVIEAVEDRSERSKDWNKFRSGYVAGGFISVGVRAITSIVKAGMGISAQDGLKAVGSMKDIVDETLNSPWKGAKKLIAKAVGVDGLGSRYPAFGKFIDNENYYQYADENDIGQLQGGLLPDWKVGSMNPSGNPGLGIDVLGYPPTWQHPENYSENQTLPSQPYAGLLPQGFINNQS